MTKYDEFVDYVLDFYGQRGIYEMSPPATLEEVESALRLRKKNANRSLPFDGDSTDREIIRDIILASRGEMLTKLEHAMVLKYKGVKP